MNAIQGELLKDTNVLNEYFIALDAMPINVFKLDLDYNIVWANKYALDDNNDLNGTLNRKCFVGFNIDMEQCTFCPVGRAITSKEVEVSLIEISGGEDNEDRIFEITAIPSFGEHGILEGIFEVRKDVTLQLDYQKLKKETKKVVKTKSKKEGFNSEVLMDIVSTELKELVLNSIKANEKMLSSKITNDQKLGLTYLKIYLIKMQNVLNNINVMRNINRGILKNSKKKADLKTIVTEKFTYYQSKIDINGNVFDYKYDPDIPNKLIFDKKKVDLMLLNLVDYAMTNSSNRGVNLLISVIDETQDVVKVGFNIRNIGSIVIHDAIKEDIDKYFKSNLALSVVKNLVENLNGSLKIIPVSGYGIDIEMILSFKKTFTFSKLPLFSKLLNKKSESTVNVGSARYKILIAEDEAIGRITMEQMLKNEYDIIFAKNGKIAVEKYITESPDLVIMDIMMPIMNGFDAYDQIERNNINRVPIIACTAKVINSEKEYLKSYGFDDYIAKPISMKTLKETIKRHLT